jgi:5'-nucleotidase
MPHILVTNDDGITAPGLLALATELRKIGTVSVVAPDRNWSAAGHVKTLERPLRAKEVKMAGGLKALACDGAPSDCVALAVLGLIPGPVDLVVSGINTDANIGHDMTYSGTVTAAMEGAINDIPAFAVSLDSSSLHTDPADYATAARMACRLAQIVLAHGLPPKTLLNVNVPDLPDEQIHGFALTRLGMRFYRDELVTRLDPRNRPYYWIGGDFPAGMVEDGTDCGALAEGYVSVTPLQLDFTAYKMIEEMQGWTELRNGRGDHA